MRILQRSCNLFGHIVFLSKTRSLNFNSQIQTKVRSLFCAFIIACHLAFSAVVGGLMSNAIGLHNLVSHQHDESSGHHHHLAITHLDHGKNDILHHHGADNFQPSAITHAYVPFSVGNITQTFFIMVDAQLPEIYPDGLLRPPRTVL